MDKIKLAVKCYFLLLKNLLLVRTLRINNVEIYDRVIICKNEIEFLWNINGCHKIKIEGVGIFPGNINGLKYRLFNNDHIEIIFFGIAKKIKKKFNFNSFEIEIPHKFIAKTELPIAIEVPYNKQKFECELSKDNLKFELQNISFEFEPFNIENYKPVNTIQ